MTLARWRQTKSRRGAGSHCRTRALTFIKRCLGGRPSDTPRQREVHGGASVTDVQPLSLTLSLPLPLSPSLSLFPSRPSQRETGETLRSLCPGHTWIPSFFLRSPLPPLGRPPSCLPPALCLCLCTGGALVATQILSTSPLAAARRFVVSLNLTTSPYGDVCFGQRVFSELLTLLPKPWSWWR